jgi:trimeric autotransporter adhesin
MSRNRKPKGRPIFLEVLESRRVLSSAASTAAAAAAAFQTEFTELTQLNSQMNPAFATFAGSVFQAESTFYSTTAGAPTGTATAPTTAMSTLQSSVSTAITTLQSTLLPEFTSVLSGSTANLSTQVQAQLTGASPGSLSNVMTSLLNASSAGTTDGSVPTTSLPLLFQAMNNTISGSYSSVAVDAYYFVTGQAYDSSGNIIPNTANNTTSSFNLSSVQGLQNTAWATAATSLFTAATSLESTSSSSTDLTSVTPGATGATVSTEANQAVTTLTQSIASSFASTPASASTGEVQALLDGSAAGSLSSQLTSLLSVAASDSDGTVPSTSLPLLYTAIDDAIDASYNGTAVSSFLLAVSPVYLPGGAGTSVPVATGTSVD